MKRLLLLAGLLISIQQLNAQDGMLDMSFADNGYKVITSNLTITTLAPDGKLVGAKKSGDGFVIYRYDTTGAPDKSFGGTGMVESKVGLDDRVAFIGVGGNGKIVIAFYTIAEPLHPFFGYTNYFGIAVYNEDGTRDQTFSNNGVLLQSYNSDSRIQYWALTVLPTNQIFLHSFYAGPGGSATNVSILADGVVNNLFNTEHQYFTTVAAYSTGKIIIGASVRQVRLRAILPDGRLDSSFGYQGDATTRIAEGVGRIAIQNDDKIIVSYEGKLYRFNANGFLDNSFGLYGIADVGFGINQLITQTNGKIIVGGVENGNYIIARFNPKGDLDQTFGNNGKTIAEGSAGDINTKLVTVGDRIYAYGNNTLAAYKITFNCTPPRFLNNKQIVKDATCSNTDGSVSLIPTTGKAPYVYSIDGGANYVNGPNSGYTFDNLASGTYNLKIKDANGCESGTEIRTVNFVCSQPTFPPPTITNVNPNAAPVGSMVTITGTNFNATPGNNIVYFGAVRAIVKQASNTSLVVEVPQGATYQPVTVTANNLTAYSVNPFSPTQKNDCANASNTLQFSETPFFTSTPSNVVVGDFDNDGKTDISTHVLYKNTTFSRANFSLKLFFGPEANGITSATGDLDGDGKLDIVVIKGDKANVFLNSSALGTIDFAAPKELVVGDAESVTISDLNGDGKPDLVFTEGSTQHINIFINKGFVGTAAFELAATYQTMLYPRSVVAGDFNEDGKPDLAVANYHSNTISIFKNLSSGTNISFDVRKDYSVGTGPRSVSMGDIDGDGLIDLAVANWLSNSISLYRNTSTANDISFGPQSLINVEEAFSVTLGDLTGDGKPEVVVPNSGKLIRIFKNVSGARAFTFETVVQKNTLYNMQRVIVADLDENGMADIVAYGAGTTTVLLNEMVCISTPGCTPPIILNNPSIVTHASCNANDGKISVKPLSGFYPFQFSIDGGATYIFGSGTEYNGNSSSHVYENLAPGTYSIRIKEGGQCESAIYLIEVKALPCETPCIPPTVQVNTVVDADCRQNNGQLKVAPSNGTMPYLYSLDGGSNYVQGPDVGYTFVNLAPGTYQLKIKDAKGCESVVTSQVIGSKTCPDACTSPTFLNTQPNVGNATCGNNDGQISIIPQSGTAPFMYSFDGGATYSPGPDAGVTHFNLAAGTYQLRLKDANGCQSEVITREVTIQECPPTTCTAPTFLNTLPIVGNATCGNNDGQISIIPTSGTAPFMYSFDGGATYVSGPNAGVTRFNLAAGTYQLKLKDADGCESAVITREVKTDDCPTTTCTAPTFLNSRSIVGDATCNQSDGQISIIPTSGTGPFMYSINGGATYVVGPNAGYTFFNLPAGTYQLRLKAGNSCESDVVMREVRMINCPSPSPTITGANKGFAFDETTSNSKLQLVAYPNPSEGRFNLQVLQAKSGNGELSIFDVTGKLVQKTNINISKGNTVPVNLSGKAKGMYYFKVVTQQGTSTSKIVVQ